MLLKLAIQNFAVLENIEIDFNHGMTVISGDSGAGKSMIIETIKYLQGKRASMDDIRYEAEKSIIEGVFDLPENPYMDSILEKYDVEKDELYIIRREILQSRKSIIKINSKIITLNALKEIMNAVIHIHEQSHNTNILDNKRQRHYLDQYIGIEKTETFSRYQEQYNEFKAVHLRLSELNEQNKTRIERIEIYKSYLDEISKLELTETLENELEEELSYLENFEAIASNLRDIKGLYNHDMAPNTTLFELHELLEKVSQYDDSYKEVTRSVNDAYHLINELSDKVSASLSGMDFDEYRLNDVQEKLAEINRLKRKHNKTYEELLEYQSYLSQSIDELENISESLNDLIKRRDTLFESLEVLSDELHVFRKEKKHLLEDAISKELEDLEIKNALFEIRLAKGKFSSSGISQVDFHFSPNVGEPVKPLKEIASGGEVSRVMLALKSIFANTDNHSVIILDEIDSGVSGAAASKMAEKMKQISKSTQTIVITHLPQTVSSSDHHLYVFKTVENDRTISKARYLKDDEHVNEIARILSGDKVTDEALENARSLISKQNR